METQLIGCSANNVSLHLKNIYQDKELSEEATTEDFSVVQQEGQREVQRTLKFYHLDAFLFFRGYKLLEGKGTVSHKKAKAHAEYECFNPTQRIDSDFDKLLRGNP